jgi:hypothetical protein
VRADFIGLLQLLYNLWILQRSSHDLSLKFRSADDLGCSSP